MAVNYCNWNYFAGIGNDPRNRHFKTVTQAGFGLFRLGCVGWGERGRRGSESKKGVLGPGGMRRTDAGAVGEV